MLLSNRYVLVWAFGTCKLFLADDLCVYDQPCGFATGFSLCLEVCCAGAVKPGSEYKGGTMTSCQNLPECANLIPEDANFAEVCMKIHFQLRHPHIPTPTHTHTHKQKTSLELLISKLYPPYEKPCVGTGARRFPSKQKRIFAD